MKLTKKKALQICMELWKWLERVNGISEDKEEWPGWEKYGKMNSSCPCCEYSLDDNNKRDCNKCPLLCIFGDMNIEYERKTDPCVEYSKSTYNRFRNSKTAKGSKKYARKIWKTCEKELKKMEEKNA